MGASSNTSTAGQRTGDADAQAATAAAMAPGNDYVRQIRDSAISKLTGSAGFRMAGDRLTDIQPTSSLAEESASVKYSPEKTTKAPGSQYLAQSASPARLTGT